jgi:hypothetical protein
VCVEGQLLSLYVALFLFFSFVLVSLGVRGTLFFFLGI